jgi:predicted acetyltransferase
MGLSVKIATISDLPCIDSLLQSYLRELSEFENIPLTPSGDYEYEYLPYYWTEKTRWPYLFYFDGKIAGFAFVRKEKEKYIMAEFTVLSEYRGYRLGLVFADEILQKHPGKGNLSTIYKTLTRIISGTDWRLARRETTALKESYRKTASILSLRLGKSNYFPIRLDLVTVLS